MRKLDYYILDVFTTQRYTGNQLSVVHTPDALSLDEYHKISREFGYSETSFIHYSETTGALEVRSFTPAGFEVNGAGHNLLGAVILALLKQWDIFKTQTTATWVSINGTPIGVNVTQKDDHLFVTMKQHPAEIIGSVPSAKISAALGLDAEMLGSNGWENKIVKTEVAHLMVPVKDLNVLALAIPNKTRLKAISEEYGFEGFYLFSTAPSAKGYLASARFFNPGIGIDEDPATGTAAGPLTGYLEKLGHIQKQSDHIIFQGEQTGHPSEIHTRVEDDGIVVSGSSVIVMEGSLYL
ncbi:MULTISPECIES: PhzF family phenazine biosynthesis protein [unclassified Pedobacter]|uniref:PhzF family phenazine biosynthesis protein n=1 Tax=unclassified Pedobacter TaxID=2628915 RepID=UPI00141FB31F|nr:MULTISPECIES: PhzF family phenazine biosynthesis protein [unclassified Pedobacter]NII83244.1 PhzF family phenazine biosynthesis protein [Pedobacter sp. SG908]NMN37114.1 PhzF family phenazine biosynthesis protein [Pedobacter sp. SG918]